jgi:hypothetical protein
VWADGAGRAAGRRTAGHTTMSCMGSGCGVTTRLTRPSLCNNTAQSSVVASAAGDAVSNPRR